MKRTNLLFWANLLLLSGIYSQSVHRLFSDAELQQDFHFLRHQLESKHPNLYAFSPKASMDALFDSLFQQLPAPATETEFYNLITVLNGRIGDGHTMFLAAFSPSDTSLFFPFHVAVKADRLFLSMNCSEDTAIVPSGEVLRINGMDAQALLRFLKARQIRDGLNTTYPDWILSHYFKSYYAFSFGHPRDFSLLLRNPAGMEASYQVSALRNDSILSIRNARYPNNRLANSPGGLAFELDKDKQVAVLRIGSFEGRTLKASSGHSFRKSLRSCFASIHDQGATSLLLDLRDNQGGDFWTSRLLLKYLVKTPTRFLQRGFKSRRLFPKKNGFRGKLYVLINGGTFSATGIVCSILQSEGRAVFIGEETGGNKVALSGGAKEYRLPNTGIHAFVSTKPYRIQAGINDGRGVLPDYEIIPAAEEVGTGEDSAMRFALDLMGGE